MNDYELITLNQKHPFACHDLPTLIDQVRREQPGEWIFISILCRMDALHDVGFIDGWRNSPEDDTLIEDAECSPIGEAVLEQMNERARQHPQEALTL